ncbi:DUF2917 domain-containing protein [Accumulibacter sp.]|uniref:DUF2917 domain-containing protein n=1 Tax=Accumulibacter sp. TaxID=2053492 RepID=UPI0026361D87|nr:DUF2917 domain-containing protein [Accumulibacter sp.]
MNFELCNSELCLADNAPIRLTSASGVRIVCTAGRVWLTVEGEAGDFFLATGDSHLVSGRGLALLEAIGSGRVRFENAASAVHGRILATWQSGWQAVRALALLDRRPASLLRVCSPQVGG